MAVEILIGDAIEQLQTLPDASVQCCVTSPPYYGLRDYGEPGQIGLEPTPEAYVARMVEVFREVARVLRDDGAVWLNIGDSYASAGGRGSQGSRGERFGRRHTQETLRKVSNWPASGIKPKDLIGIPWMLAFALRADGWYLRQDVIWAKPNPMPESTKDRTTKAHEYVFLMTKNRSYFWDGPAISEPSDDPRGPGNKKPVAEVTAERPGLNANLRGSLHKIGPRETRNRRSVWWIATAAFPQAHFATMPAELAEICIKSVSRVGDTVLDPFGGAGTTGLVADRLQRQAILIELNPEYAAMARARIAKELPLMAAANV